MENRYQFLLSKQGRPIMVVQPMAMQLLALDVSNALSQRQFKQVKKQRISYFLAKNRHYRTYVLDRYKLLNNRWRYWLVMIDYSELMAEWRSCYQRLGYWPKVSLGVLQLKFLIEKYAEGGRSNLVILSVTASAAVLLLYQENKLQDYQQLNESAELKLPTTDEIWVVSASVGVEQRWLEGWQCSDRIQIVTESELMGGLAA